MKIKVKVLSEDCKIKSSSKGEWVDLKSMETLIFNPPHSSYKTRETVFDSKLVPLGICMQLPKYFEANIVPRSSTFINHGIIMWNHFGVVDSSYSGNGDVWKFGAIALERTTINRGDRIAQFRIQPSQFAPWYIKLKWLFTNKIEFVFVENLNNEDRGGFGSTGVK